MSDTEDEAQAPCPICRGTYECLSNCDQIAEDWMRSNGDL